MTGNQRSGGGAIAAPVLPTTTPATAADALRDLRRWQLGAGPGGPLPPDALPALLAPFRDPERVRHDYPLVVARTADGVAARPLGDVLPELGKHATTQPRVVADNLQRLERRLRTQLGGEPSTDLAGMLRAAGEHMVAELQLRDTIAAGLEADLAAMGKALPEAQLLPLEPGTPLRLLLAVAQQRTAAARERLTARVRSQTEALRGLLQVEAQKDPAARSPESLQKSLGTVGAQFLDPESIARSVGAHRGTQRAGAARRARLQEALAALERHLAAAPWPALVLVHGGSAPQLSGAAAVAADDVCTAAMRQFDDHAAALLAAVRALHVAELEQRGAYEPDRHDPRLQALGWQDLGPADLHALPAVVVLAPADELAGQHMQALTRLCVSGRPVQVLALQSPAQDPGDPDADKGHARLELGYLGVGFRDVYVQQSTAARPAHLLAGFLCALRGSRTGLHVVDPGLAADGGEPALGAFLHAGAAIEGRAHPLFHYDPEAGETWTKRLDFAGNPGPDADWPTSALGLRNASGAAEALQLAFTFADYALLEPRWRQAFAPVPESIGAADLLPLAEWLQQPAEAASRTLPFVWIATGEAPGRLQRVAVRRALAQACRDRQRFWRTLQELAGVRNDHVREAVQRARQEAAEQAARERQALVEQHAHELGQLRAEATGQAMQGLARMLLDLDPMPDLAAAAPLSAVAAAPGAAAAPAAAAPAKAAAAAAAPSEEPWIETERCSTCNDCINLNPLMFAYNENKQAKLVNPKAGTYAQLVQAAEKCPARCIHPGKPLNPAEPNLEKLIARAAPFNR